MTAQPEHPLKHPEPLLLLPGMMCDARLFAPQMAAFAHQRAVMVAPLTRADSMADIAADVLANAPPADPQAGKPRARTPARGLSPMR